jgi:hypothetical protein
MITAADHLISPVRAHYGWSGPVCFAVIEVQIESIARHGCPRNPDVDDVREINRLNRVCLGTMFGRGLSSTETGVGVYASRDTLVFPRSNLGYQWCSFEVHDS